MLTVYTYDRRTASNDPEQWRSDLRRMTKIYKSIPPAPEDKKLDLFLEAKGLFTTFHNNFDAWIYDDLLPSREPKKQNWREQQVAKTAWTAVLAISPGSLFPNSWNYKTDEHEPAVYELERQIDRNITRYQRAFNIAFKEIAELLKERGASGKESLPAIELLRVGPVQVVVHNQGREARGAEEDLDDELRSLSNAIHKIEHAGFPGAVKGLTVHVSFVQTALIAGQYSPDKDELFLFPLGIGRENHETLIHECGHRFYYRSLPPKAREHWKETFDARALTLEDSDVDHMVDKYVKPYVAENGHTPMRDTLHRMIREESVELTTKLRDLGEHAPAFTNDPEEVRSFWKKNYVGNRVNLEEITDYGATNEKEAFAEAFMLYVVKGPRAVGPWTRQFFETVSRSGGAKLAQNRVLERFLAGSSFTTPSRGARS